MPAARRGPCFGSAALVRYLSLSPLVGLFLFLEVVVSLAVRQHLACAAAAHRVLKSRRPAPPPRRVSTGVRRGFVALVVAVVLVAQGTVASAFLGLDPAGWLVVTQMTALVSQMTAIKRQVENYRDQARAHVYGKIAPLDGKLTPLDNLLKRSSDPVQFAWYAPPGQTPIPTEPVNQPYEDCAIAPPDVPCMPNAADTLVSDQAQDDLRQQLLDANRQIFGNTLPTHIVESTDRLIDNIRYRVEHSEEQREVAEAEQARYRAAVELSASILEEWRGCNEATDTSPYTLGSVGRPPCLTRNGEGRGESLSDGQQGTEGLVEGLSAGLEFVIANQEGDASLTQLATMETQVNLMRGRLQAAELELDIAAAEQAQRAQLKAEARRRRDDQLSVLRIECLQGNNGGTIYNISARTMKTRR